MSTPPSSLAWRSGVGPAGLARRAEPSTAGSASSPASGRGRGRRDPVGPEGVERPVLQEDVDRLAERRGAGGQDRRGLQLVVGSGEEDQVERAHPSHHLVGLSAAPDWRPPMLGHPAEPPGQAPLQHRAHDPAGDHHVGVGQAVADLAAVTLGLDDARRAEGPPGAARRWAGSRRSARQATDLDRARAPARGGSRDVAGSRAS